MFANLLATLPATLYSLYTPAQQQPQNKASMGAAIQKTSKGETEGGKGDRERKYKRREKGVKRFKRRDGKERKKAKKGEKYIKQG